MAAERGRQLLAAHVERAGGDGAAFHALDDVLQAFVLLFLVRQVVPVHVEEFGAQQADTGGAAGHGAFDVARQFDIGVEDDRRAVAGHRRQVAQPLQRFALARQILLPGLEAGKRGWRWVDEDAACDAVHHHRSPVFTPGIRPATPSTAGRPSERAMMAV